MNYYERHLGDYARDTGHLSPLEHGIYTLLMDRYYATEEPIPQDQAHRICRARTKEEREATDVVLGEFFQLEEGAYRHRRIEEELTKARARIESSKENGKRGGRPKKNPVGFENETQPKPDGFPVGSSDETQSKAHQAPDTKHHHERATTATAVVVAGKPATPDCPHAEIVALYHEALPELRRVRDWTPDRQAFLRARWREKPARQNLDWWRKFFGYVRDCPFLMGEGAQSADRPPFTADLEWLVRPQNFRKVIEGKYQRRAA